MGDDTEGKKSEVLCEIPKSEREVLCEIPKGFLF